MARYRGDYSDRSDGNFRRFVVIFMIAIILAMSAFVAFWFITHDNSETFEQMGFWEFHSSLDRTEIGFVFDGQRSEFEWRPIFVDGELYLPIDLVQNYIDEHIFWDGGSRVSVTTRTQAFRIDIGQLAHTVNGVSAQLDLPVIMRGGQPYIPAGFVAELHGFTFDFKQYINTIVMLDTTAMHSLAHVRYDDEPLRFEAGGSRNIPFFQSRSPVLVQRWLSVDETFIVVDSEGDFYRIQTQDGLLGYVASDMVTFLISSRPPEVPPEPIFDGMVNMVWDLTSNSTVVRNEARRYVPYGLNVISPTFFEFSPALDGTILSIADQGYVDWAHSNGWQVWALIADKLDGHFHSDVSRHVFTNTAHREWAIDQIVAFVEQYSFDGICVNFEAIRADYADSYIQFLRELAPLLRERGVILSVTMFVPMNHNLFYNREQAALAADFIIIMGYDEHWATSPIAGPNASIGFVQNGINRTLWEVPSHQIILGIPLYVRVWRETELSGGIVVSQAAMGMDAAHDLFVSNGAEFAWDDITMSYYAEFRGVDADGQSYRRRVWLEEERSISAKLDLVIYHELAGTAGWRKGLERAAIWDVLAEYLR